jgi:uncharacterized protein YcfL
MKKYILNSILILPIMAFLLIGCSSPTDSSGGSSNGNDDDNDDGGGTEPTAANVTGQETGVSYSQGSYSASISYRLSNTGETTAYNVQYRLKISYKCITGFPNQGWTDEFLPSSSSLYSYGDIAAGQSVDFNNSIQLCSGLGIEQFTFEVYQVIWD